MLTNSSVLSALLIVLAIVGGFAVVGIVGMAIMHGSMMGSEQMSAMCRDMLGTRS